MGFGVMLVLVYVLYISLYSSCKTRELVYVTDDKSVALKKRHINLSSCPLFLSLTPRSTNTQSYILPLPLTFHPADLESLCHFILGWTKMHISVSSRRSHPL